MVGREAKLRQIIDAIRRVASSDASVLIAVVFCSGDEVTSEFLPAELPDKESRNIPFVIPPHLPIEEIEREAILQTLARTSGNVTLSAQILHYPRPTFYRKLKKFGIKVERNGTPKLAKRATA
jgi:DNA-binding NtrC family response regulator